MENMSHARPLSTRQQTASSKATGKRRSSETGHSQESSSAQTSLEPQRLPWWSGTLAIALTGSVLLWLAFPPVDWWPLAWVAPIPWIVLIQMPRLPGRRPYRALWFAGFVFWMGALHWLRLPYWATGFGWIVLSIYLGLYLPVFVALARRAVHGWGLSTLWVVPVVWTALELARAHLLGGFLMASIGHTQYRWLEVIQISDLGGSYAVTFLVMLVAACLARMWDWKDRRIIFWPISVAGAAGAVVVLYGNYRLGSTTPLPGPTVLLVQGSIDTEMKADPTLRQDIYREYFSLSHRVTTTRDDIDLVIWPETMFRDSLFSHDDDAQPPPGAGWTIENLTDAERYTRELLATTAIQLGAPVLFGVDCLHFRSDRVERHNSAVLVHGDGTMGARYDKMHPVLFGEYIPLAEKFPWLYSVSPLSGGVLPGKQPVAIEVAGVQLAPSICYENILPHLIAGQIRTLRRAGKSPDVLVNLTNDGWFWGSSELDMHLTCALFRAIECRMPMLVAANTGFSAWIDSNGRIVRRGPRRDTGTILAEVALDPRESLYLSIGDWPWAICLLFSITVAIDLVVQHRRGKRLLVPTSGKSSRNKSS